MIIGILIFLFIGSMTAYALGDGVIMTLEAAEKRKPKTKTKRKWFQRSPEREEKIQQLIKKRDEYRRKAERNGK